MAITVTLSERIKAASVVIFKEPTIKAVKAVKQEHIQSVATEQPIELKESKDVK